MMMRLKAREGDFVETLEDLIFDVKGLIHPPNRVVAYLRYMEDPSGNRKKGEKTYVKVYSLSEREKILRSRFPQYLYYDPVFGEHLQEVPNNKVSKLYQPAEKVSELLNRSSLDQVEAQSIEFVKRIRDYSSISFGKFGLSGSVLVNLHTESSDIDLIVYGGNNCRVVYEALRQLMRKKNSDITSYSIKDLEKLYEFRSKDTWMPIQDFLRIERRKFLQGKFEDRDFFIRFILDWDEITENYGDRMYKATGYGKIEAKIEDDTDSIFTPCRYIISETKILEGTRVPSLKEIVSFRGRFCEQAKKGEAIVAQGKIEKVSERDGTEYFRLILGAKPSDFMISK